MNQPNLYSYSILIGAWNDLSIDVLEVVREYLEIHLNKRLLNKDYNVFLEEARKKYDMCKFSLRNTRLNECQFLYPKYDELYESYLFIRLNLTNKIFVERLDYKYYNKYYLLNEELFLDNTSSKYYLLNEELFLDNTSSDNVRDIFLSHFYTLCLQKIPNFIENNSALIDITEPKEYMRQLFRLEQDLIDGTIEQNPDDIGVQFLYT